MRSGHEAPLDTVPQTPTTITRALSELHLTADSHADTNLDARLENFSKELVDIIAFYLEPRDIGALSATSKQLDSKLFDRKFEHLHFFPCKSEQKLRDIQNIASHEEFRFTVRSVTMRIFLNDSRGPQIGLAQQMPEILPLLQKAANLTYLTIKDGNAETLLPAITLPSLKKLSLFHVALDLETIIDFINVQPKLEKLHIDVALIQDVELGDIEEDLGPEDLGGPAIEEERLGYQASVLIKERTALRNIMIDEPSDRLREPWCKDRRRSQRMIWNGQMFVERNLGPF